MKTLKAFTSLGVAFSFSLGLQAQNYDPPQGGNYFDDPDSSFYSSVNQFTIHLQNLYPNDSSEGGSNNAFKKWQNFWENRMSYNAPAGTEKTAAANSALRQSLNASGWEICNQEQFQGNWECMGPFNDYYGNPNNEVEKQGRVEQIWVDPNDEDYILLGSNSGGVWKSTDGGLNWANITDGKLSGNYRIPGTIGINNLTVDPLNTNTIYLSTGIYTLHDVNAWSYGLGVLYSTDGGNSWQEDHSFNQVAGSAKHNKVQKMRFKPGGHELIAVLGNAEVLYKANSSSSWTSISSNAFPSGYVIHDFEYSKVDPNKVVFSGKDGILRVYNMSTNSWSSLPALTPNTGDILGSNGITDISLSSQDEAIGFVHLSGSGNPAKQAIWLTNINTPSWQEVNNNVNGFRAYINLEVSPSNANIIYFTDQSGANRSGLHQSTDGGQSIQNISGHTHADGRVLYIYSSSNTSNGINDVVFAGTDGGIVKKASGSSTFSSITGNGLGITQFYGVSSSDANDGLLLGGAQDNGLVNYVKQRPNSWQAVIVGDGFLPKFARNGVPRALGGNNYPSLMMVDFSNPLNPVTSSDNFVRDYSQQCPLPFLPCANNLRPIHFDENNTQYIGYKEVYSRPDFLTPWSRAFNNDPQQNSQDLISNKVGALAFAPNNSEMVYIAYRRESGFDGQGQPLPKNKLFVTTNRSSNPVTWTNISPPAVSYFRIMDIAIDPQNPGRIWAAMGNIDWGHIDTTSLVGTDTVNRVFFSPDTGKTWRNVSIGLPALPANKIVYQEGSDDILYLATDVGVYKWNKQNYQWECFMNGMPPCLVLDLEINYCSGKLRAGTWGRGAWETDLEDAGIEASKIINFNELWTSSRTLHSGIRIKSGATLTISGAGTSIFMPKNAPIIIEPNARLIVNDATITNGCDQSLWGGIRMEGDQNQVQSPLYQPLVELNNARIENAIVAVANYDADKSFNSTGGIIKATNTTFLNNEKAVDLSYYHKLPITFVKPYQAQFTQCTFDINDDYKFDNGNGYTGSNPHRFFSHVSLYEVDGVRFNGCSFRNSNTGQYQAWGEGIFSSNAGFSATAYCTSPTIPCNPADLEKNTFIGFKHGIWAEHDNLLNNFPIKVDQAAFDSCSIGIRMKHQFISHLTRNEFIIGNGKEIDINTFDCHKNIGIFVTSTEAPSIEDNDMTGVSHAAQDPDHENIGIVVENTRGADIRVYKNKLQSLHKACLALGSNDYPKYHYLNNSKGLQFLCNEFNNNENDLYISGEAYEGIADHQGSLQSDAGNTFQGTSANHIANYASPFVYYYDGISGSNQPTLISTSSFVNVLASNASNDCPSHFDPAGGNNWNVPLSAGDLTGMKADFAVIRQGKSDAITTLDGFIDQGNTPGLLSYIENCLPHEAIDLRDSLLTIAPYVSEEALRAAAEKNIMTGGDLFTVLKANPDVLKSEDFLKHLENGIPAPFTPEEVNTLRAESAVSTGRTAMEAAIADYVQQMNLYANEIVAHYSLDTSDVDKDSIPIWYDQMNTVQAEYAKATFYTGTGDYGSAESVLSNLPNKFELSEEALSDHEAYYATWQVAKAVLDDGRNTLQMNATELSDLQAIANSGINATGRSIYTIDVITDQIGPSYRLACPNLILMGEGRIKATNTSSALSETSVHAYPNPANTQVRFDYTGNQNTQLEVLLSNASGQEVYRSTLNQLSGSIHLDISTLSPGVYTYQLRDSGKVLQSEKLIISR